MEILKKKWIFSFLVFLITFFIYFFSNLSPTDHYKHYIFLADAFLKGRVSLEGLPFYYQDLVFEGRKVFVPFPPTPAILLMLPVAIWGVDFVQPFFAMFLGSINAVLVFYLFKKKPMLVRIILWLFFAFGTVHWYASVIGTTWFLASVVAVFFTLLSLISFFEEKFFLSGLFLGLAATSRHPTAMGIIFFILFLKRKKNNFSCFLKFFEGIIPTIILQGVYNYLRFGNFFQEGYGKVYQGYISSPYPYSIFKLWFPQKFRWFGYLDPRNVPAHLATLFLLLPEKINTFPFFKPSPYGMSIFLTSPLLIYVLKVNIKEKIVKFAWLAVILIFIPISFHYMQGWVQFGYRFLLDFLPYLLIILAEGLPKRLNFLVTFLLLFSIASNYFGVWWGRKLGW